MKPKPDEVRKLAKQLYCACHEKQQEQGWSPLLWSNMSKTTKEVWDAVAEEAFKRIKRK